MALLATSTMDSSFGGCDEFPEMGGHLVSQLTMLWEHDAGCVADVAGLQLADVNMAAPEFLADSIISSEPAISGLATKSEWKFFPSFPDDFVDGEGFDIESLIGGQIPVPPAADSPLQDVDHEMSWMTTCLDMSMLADVTTDPLKYVSAPGSPDSGVSSLDTATYPDSVASPETSFSPSPELTMQTVSQEDLALLHSLWENDPPIPAATSSETGPETLLTTVALEADSFVKSSPQPMSRSPKTLKSSSKPAKALLAVEKRERKRVQNKNAATRYREKKRDEERLVYEEQTGLEEKNKSLKDKVTLISREIQCMKELLTEVYRAKGVIE